MGSVYGVTAATRVISRPASMSPAVGVDWRSFPQGLVNATGGRRVLIGSGMFQAILFR